MQESKFAKYQCWYMLVIVVCASIAYSNSFKVPFIFDDISGILGKQSIRSLSNFIDPAAMLNNRYFGDLTFALNYAANGVNVTGYHIVNLLIHLVASLLVFRLVALLLQTPILDAQDDQLQFPLNLLPFLTALFFALHPLQTQAVTYTVQRYTSLATMLYLLSLVFYLQGRLAGRKTFSLPFLLSMAAALLAMKTKEIAFTLPFMVTVIELCFFKGSARERIWLLAPLTITVLVIPLSMMLSGQDWLATLAKSTAETEVIPRWYYLLTQFGVIATYIRLIILPINQQFDYEPKLVSSLIQPEAYLPFSLHILLITTALYLFYRGRKHNQGVLVLAAFGVFWFYLALSVESSLIPIRDVIFEHRVYLPSVGALLAILALLLYGYLRLKPKQPAAANIGTGILLIAAVAFGIASYHRNAMWRDQVTLLQDNIKKSPLKPRLRLLLGGALLNQNRLEEAQHEMEMANLLKPDARAFIDLAMIDNRAGNPDKALDKLAQAEKIAIPAVLPLLHLNRSYSLKIKGDAAGAEQELLMAVRLDTNMIEAHYNLGVLYVSMNRAEDAIKEFTIAVQLNPQLQQGHYNLATMYADQNNHAKALLSAKRAVELAPDNLDYKKLLESLSGTTTK